MEAKGKVFLGLLILVCLGLAFFLITKFVTNTTGFGVYDVVNDNNVAKCLSDKEVVLYLNGDCAECMEQLKEFSDNLRFLNLEVCENNKCPVEGQNIVWLVDKEYYSGFMYLDDFLDLIGCR